MHSNNIINKSSAQLIHTKMKLYIKKCDKLSINKGHNSHECKHLSILQLSIQNIQMENACECVKIYFIQAQKNDSKINTTYKCRYMIQKQRETCAKIFKIKKKILK